MWGVASFLGIWIIVQSVDLIFKFIFGALIVGLGLGFFFFLLFVMTMTMSSVLVLYL